METSIRLATWDDRARILELVTTMGGHEDVVERVDPVRTRRALARRERA